MPSFSFTLFYVSVLKYIILRLQQFYFFYYYCYFLLLLFIFFVESILCVLIYLFFLCSAYVNEERPRGQVIKFASGDDLEDDFFTDDKHGGNKDGSSESKVGSVSNSKESCVKPKKKQGPSIVNFVD